MSLNLIFSVQHLYEVGVGKKKLLHVHLPMVIPFKKKLKKREKRKEIKAWIPFPTVEIIPKSYATI